MNLDEFAKKLDYHNKWWLIKDLILITLFLSIIANYWVNEKNYCQMLVKWYNKTCPIMPENWNPDLPYNFTGNYSTGNWTIKIGD